MLFSHKTVMYDVNRKRKKNVIFALVLYSLIDSQVSWLYNVFESITRKLVLSSPWPNYIFDWSIHNLNTAQLYVYNEEEKQCYFYLSLYIYNVFESKT